MPFGRKRTDSQEIKGFFTVSVFYGAEEQV